MRYLDNIEKLVVRSYLKNLDVPVDAGVDERILGDAVARMEELKKTKPAFTKPMIWRTVMKNHRTQFAAAVVIIITVLIGVHYLGGSIDDTSIAWADVLEQISTFRPYTCTYTVQAEGMPTQTKHLMRVSLTQRREIRSDGIVLVFDLAIPKCLTLMPEKKHAIERIYDMEPRTDPDLLKLVKSMESRAFGEGAVQEIGVKKIEGHVAKGFRSVGKHNDITVWADVKTILPVRVEIIHVGLDTKITMSEFTFDVDLDEVLFSTKAPDGYTVEKINEKAQKLELTEADLIEGLRVVAILLDGRFPPGIEPREMQKVLREYIKQNNLSESEIKERLTSVVEKWRKAHSYINLLKKEKEISDFHFNAEGVKLGDADKSLIWWLPKNSETYRVIYGDLSVKDVIPEGLPK